MSDFALLVEDLAALQAALQAAGHTCTRERDGALVVSCTLYEARRVARVAGVRVRQTWPPAYQLPTPPAAIPPADIAREEEAP